MSEKKTFKIATLGCRTNQYESQGYHDQLIQLGYQPAKGEETADLCIVNTCTVTESADSSSRHEIRALIRDNPQSQVVVTGCYAERNPEAIAAIPGVGSIVPNAQKEQLIADLFPGEDVPEFQIQQFAAHTRAFVKVQDGCNSFCTYCIIPYVRGRSRSRSVAEIVKEVEGLIANGYKEVVLTGINIGDFDGNGTEERLADLVRAVDQVPGLKRLRISSIDPDEVDDALIQAVLEGQNTCHSLHVVLQAGSNSVLKRMNRKYTRQIFMQTVDRLKSLAPHFTFTTDVIVGFPGESEADFADTLAVMREVEFAKVHMFPYSERPRTKAAQYPNKIAPEVIRERKNIVLRLAEETAHSLRQRFLGQVMTVLTEAPDPNLPGGIVGHTANFLPVFISGDYAANTLVTVTLTENTPTALVGIPRVGTSL